MSLSVTAQTKAHTWKKSIFWGLFALQQGRVGRTSRVLGMLQPRSLEAEQPGIGGWSSEQGISA